MSESNNGFKMPIQPGNPEDNSGNQPTLNAMAQLKSAQTLITIAMIGGPLSLIVGGVLLSSISVICAAIALFKLKSIAADDASTRDLVGKVKRSAIVSFAISLVALVLNAAVFIAIAPVVIEAYTTGDVTALQELMGYTNAGSATEEPGSLWG